MALMQWTKRVATMAVVSIMSGDASVDSNGYAPKGIKQAKHPQCEDFCGLRYAEVWPTIPTVRMCKKQQ